MTSIASLMLGYGFFAADSINPALYDRAAFLLQNFSSCICLPFYVALCYADFIRGYVAILWPSVCVLPHLLALHQRPCHKLLAALWVNLCVLCGKDACTWSDHGDDLLPHALLASSALSLWLAISKWSSHRVDQIVGGIVSSILLLMVTVYRCKTELLCMLQDAVPGFWKQHEECEQADFATAPVEDSTGEVILNAMWVGAMVAFAVGLYSLRNQGRVESTQFGIG